MRENLKVKVLTAWPGLLCHCVIVKGECASVVKPGIADSLLEQLLKAQILDSPSFCSGSLGQMIRNRESVCFAQPGIADSAAQYLACHGMYGNTLSLLSNPKS